MAGVVWLIMQTISQRAFGFVGQILLARLLIPSDFGEAALALSFIYIATSLVGFGLDDVLIQRGTAARFWHAAVIRVAFGAGIVAFGAVWLAAPVTANILGGRETVTLLRVSSLIIPVQAILVVPTASLRSQLRFRFLTLASTFETVIAMAGSVILAYLGFGALSLVAPAVFAAVVKFFILNAKVRIFDSHPAAKRRQYVPILVRGSAVLGHRLVTSVLAQADNLIVGAVSGTVELGYYYFAFRLVAQPINLLAGNVHAVLFPYLVRGDESGVSDTLVIEICYVLNLGLSAVCTLLIVLAEPLTIFIFGPQWRDSVPITQLLCLGLAFEAATRIPGALLSARGQFARIFLYAAVPAPVFLLLVFLGAKTHGGAGVALAVSIYYIIHGPTVLFLCLSDRMKMVAATLKVYAVPVLISVLSGMLGVTAPIVLGVTSSLAKPVIETLTI